MAVRMIPHGRRGWLALTRGSQTRYYPVMAAQFAQPRNLIVPPVLSRDWEFATVEGVRIMQGSIQIPCFLARGANTPPATGLDEMMLDWLFLREDEWSMLRFGDTVEGTLHLFDGVNRLTWQRVKANSVATQIQKGGLVMWNIAVMGTGVSNSPNSAPGGDPWNTPYQYMPWGNTSAPYPTPVSFRDVEFYIRENPSSAWRRLTVPVYGMDVSISHNLIANAPITDHTGANLLSNIARFDAGPLVAACGMTIAHYPFLSNANTNPARYADLTPLLSDNAGIALRVARGDGNAVEIRMNRVVPENPIDTTAQFGQQFRSIRFRVLGNPLSDTPGGPGEPPVSVVVV